MKKPLTISNADRLAPGHVYLEALGSGIQWTPERVHLWENGRLVESAVHTTVSASEYFHGLHFAISFSSVSHWWFRSAWTQKVRVSGLQGLMDAGTAWGYMQFIDESVPAKIWTAGVVDGRLTEIAAPFPPNEVQPVNLPLRLALARLVAGIISDEVLRDEWLVITSLVRRDELERVFPTAIDQMGWRLEGVSSSLRRKLCHLQGLEDVQ